MNFGAKLAWTWRGWRFKSAGTFPNGQMAKRKPVGFAFRFPVSFRAIAWGWLFVGFGFGQSYCAYLRFFCVLFGGW